MGVDKLLVAAVLALSIAGRAVAFDVVLDPKRVSQLLAEITKFHDDWKNGKTKQAQLDGLYEMGERVLDLTELMTQDLSSHGNNDQSLIALIERRLKENGVVISRVKAGYAYDLAAFREYVRLAPTGGRALEARYVLVGFDEPGEDVAGLLKSMSAKEAFIRDYPTQKKDALSEQQRKAAQDRYRRIIRLYPSTEEAETARDALNP
jgi:ribosomal protein S6